jgi:hypothetical protein
MDDPAVGEASPFKKMGFPAFRVVILLDREGISLEWESFRAVGEAYPFFRVAIRGNGAAASASGVGILDS